MRSSVGLQLSADVVTRRIFAVLGILSLLVVAACGGGTVVQPSAPAATASAATSTAIPANADPELVRIYETIIREEMPGVPFSVLEGAKKEGKVVLYQTAREAANELLAAEFTKRFPFIEIETFQASSVPLFERFMTEKRAGNHRIDLLQQGGSQQLQEAHREGYIEAYRISPENESKFQPGSFDESGLWYATSHGTVIVYAYNTNLVTPEQIKALEQFDSLWSDALKGLPIAIPSAAATKNAQAWYYQMEKTYGEEVWQKIKALEQSGGKVYEGGAPAGTALSRGEVAVALISESQSGGLWNQGAPIRWTIPMPAITNLSYQAIVSKAPNPNAARLLQEFVMSKPGQTIFASEAYPSPRTDVPDARKFVNEPWFIPHSERKFGTDYDDPDFVANADAVIEKFREVFLR